MTSYTPGYSQLIVMSMWTIRSSMFLVIAWMRHFLHSSRDGTIKLGHHNFFFRHFNTGLFPRKWPRPSSMNSIRSRKAYAAKIQAFRAVVKRKTNFHKDLRAVIDARSASKRRRRGELPPKITVSPETFVDTLPVPKTYEEAITGPYRDYWIKAIADELDNLRNYGVWKVQRLPKNVRPVKGKFVFRWKPNAANTLDKPKARFTLKGYSQKKGIH